MNEQFNELILHLQSLGYEPDNEDLMDLDLYHDYGYVTFYGPDHISVQLKFEDYQLDLNGQGHVLKFSRKSEIRVPFLNLDHFEIKNAEREFYITLDLITLTDDLDRVMKYAIDVLSNVKVR